MIPKTISITTVLVGISSWIILKGYIDSTPSALPANFTIPEPLRYRWPKYELTFTNGFGKKLATYSWLPESPPKGSMGGALALRMMIEEPELFNGAFLSAPAIKASDDLYPILRKIARIAAEWIPTLPVAPALNENQMCLDVDVDLYNKHDPLFYNGRIRPKTAVEYLDNFEFLQENIHRMRVPFLCMHGELDSIIKFEETSKILYEKAQTTDKTLKVLKGELHNFQQSFKAKEYMDEIISWIEARV